MTMLGKTAWNKGIKFPHSEQWEKNRLAAVRKASKLRIYQSGYHRPPSAIKPMLEAMKKDRMLNPEKYRLRAIRNLSRNRTLSLSGSNSPNWRGGITSKSTKIRNKYRREFSNLRKEVLTRDNFACRDCGSKENLDVNHIIGFSECILTAFLRMNCVTLCRKCHLKTNNWGGRGRIKNELNKPFAKTGTPMFLIRTIPHHWQEYNTCGNYAVTDNGLVVIFVSDMGDREKEMLVALHEMIEYSLTKHAGIKVKDIDAFDIQFEKEREAGLHGDQEPGDNINAPYRKEHFFAESVEKMVAHRLGVDWRAYNKALDKVSRQWRKRK